MEQELRKELHNKLDQFLDSLKSDELGEGELSSISFEAYWNDGYDEETEEKLYTFSVETKRNELRF